MRHLLRAIAGGVLAVAGAAAAAGAQEISPDSLARLVERARAAPASPSPWRGFDMRTEVLIAPVMSGGPTVIAGDRTAPAGYHRSAVAEDVFVRLGSPPDSLSALQLARDWNERPAVATVVPLGPNDRAWLETAVHEAFHSYQNRTGSQGAPMLPLLFGDTLLALGILEGRTIAAAVRAADGELAERIAAALTVRQARCEAAGVACSHLRMLEAVEGSAKYVASLRIVGSDGLVARALADTTSVYTVLRPSPSSLARFHAYGTGEIWMVLLDRLGVPAWPDRVMEYWQGAGGPSPDELIARHIGWRGDLAAGSLGALMAGEDGQAALAHARSEVAAAGQQRAAQAQAGPPADHTLVRIIIPGDTQVGMSMTAMRGGGREVRRIMGDDLLVTRQRYREQGATVWSPLAGRSIEVDGIALPLDAPGEATGRVVLELPEVRALLSRAHVLIQGHEVVITYPP